MTTFKAVLTRTPNSWDSIPDHINRSSCAERIQVSLTAESEDDAYSQIEKRYENLIYGTDHFLEGGGKVDVLIKKEEN